MKTLIERLENDITFAGRGPVVVRSRDLRALIAAYKTLREAAGAFVVALEKTVCSSFVYECRVGEAGCESIATRLHLHRGPMDPACDYCVNVAVEADVISETDLKDLPIAAPLRALRAALKEEP